MPAVGFIRVKLIQWLRGNFVVPTSEMFDPYVVVDVLEAQVTGLYSHVSTFLRCMVSIFFFHFTGCLYGIE